MQVQKAINMIIRRMKHYSDKSDMYVDMFCDFSNEHNEQFAERALKLSSECCHIIACYHILLIQLAKIQRRERLNHG